MNNRIKSKEKADSFLKELSEERNKCEKNRYKRYRYQLLFIGREGIGGKYKPSSLGFLYGFQFCDHFTEQQFEELCKKYSFSYEIHAPSFIEVFDDTLLRHQQDIDKKRFKDDSGD